MCALLSAGGTRRVLFFHTWDMLDQSNTHQNETHTLKLESVYGIFNDSTVVLQMTSAGYNSADFNATVECSSSTQSVSFDFTFTAGRT